LHLQFAANPELNLVNGSDGKIGISTCYNQ